MAAKINDVNALLGSIYIPEGRILTHDKVIYLDFNLPELNPDPTRGSLPWICAYFEKRVTLNPSRTIKKDINFQLSQDSKRQTNSNCQSIMY